VKIEIIPLFGLSKAGEEAKYVGARLLIW